MALNLQIATLTFSFLFGICFSVFLTLNHKIIYHSNKFIKTIGTILIVGLSNIIYFIGLKYIDNATFHPYMLFALVLGFYLEIIISKYIKKIIVKHKLKYVK